MSADPTSPVGSPGWCLVTGRPGGVSEGPYASLNLAEHVGDDPAAVRDNRARAAAGLGVAPDDLAVMRATHGNSAFVVTDPAQFPDGDILLTRQPGIGVAALAADCVPFALLDSDAGVVAAVHSGWRGVAGDAAGAAVAAMVGEGARPDRIVAHLGPAICPRCYEVSEQVRQEVCAAASDAWAVTDHGTPAVALHAAVRQQLAAAGVAAVTADATCTAESADLFSYRRDGVTGRQGILARLPESL